MSDDERLRALFEEQSGQSFATVQKKEEPKPESEEEDARLQELYIQQSGTPVPSIPTPDGRHPAVQSQETVGSVGPGKYGEDFGRVVEIAASRFNVGVLNFLQFPFQTVAGAMDEIAFATGITEGGFPVSEALKEVSPLDEAEEFLASGITPRTPLEHGVAVGAQMGGESVVPLGGLAARGKSVLAGRATGAVPSSAPQTLSESVLQRPGKALGVEAGLSTAGGIGAGTFASFSEPEMQEEMADIGGIAGGVSAVATPILFRGMTTISPLRWGANYVANVWDRYSPVIKGIFDREAFEGMSLKDKINPKNWGNLIDASALDEKGRQDVLKHLKSLVPDELRPDIEKRLDTWKFLNELEPDFNPSVGAIIGTEKAKLFQQLVDADDYDFAINNYQKTQQAILRLRDRIAKDPSLAQKEDLADAMDAYAADTKAIIELTQARVDDAARTSLRSLFALDNADDLGREERAVLTEMKEMYKTFVDDLYFSVKIPDSVDFTGKELKDTITWMVDPRNPDALSDDAPAYLRTNLPKMFKAMTHDIFDDMGAKIGEELEPFTFNQLKSIYQRLGAEKASLLATNPHSVYLRNIEDLRTGIMATLEKQVQGFADAGEDFTMVLKDWATAKTFMKDEYVPRFRQGTIGDIFGYNKDGTRAIDDSALMRNLWQRGEKVDGAKQFRTLMEEDVGEEFADLFDEQSLAKLAEYRSAAKQSLKDYAFSTLAERLEKDPKALTNPQKVIDNWKVDFRGSLDQFPWIKKEVESYELVYDNIAETARRVQEQNAEISRNIVNRYIGVDPNALYRKILGTPGQPGSARYVENLMGDIELAYNHPGSEEKYKKIVQSVNNVVVNQLLDEAWDPVAKQYKYADMTRALHTHREVLSTLLGPEDYNNIVAFNRGLQLMDDMPNIIPKGELNQLKELLSKAGISPASILSRYYSASLGKVGPVYLGTDAATRFFTKKAETYFHNIYRELMYNPESIKLLDKVITEGFEEVGRRSRVRNPSYFPLLLSQMGINIADDYDDYMEQAVNEMLENEFTETESGVLLPPSEAHPAVQQQ